MIAIFKFALNRFLSPEERDSIEREHNCNVALESWNTNKNGVLEAAYVFSSGTTSDIPALYECVKECEKEVRYD